LRSVVVSDVDDAVAAIGAAVEKSDETANAIAEAKATSEEFAGMLAMTGIEDRAANAAEATAQLEEAQGMQDRVRQTLGEARALVESVKGEPVGASTGGAAPTAAPGSSSGREPPPTFMPPAGYPVNKPHTMLWSDLHHVAYGDPDNPRKGGHLHGTGRPGKTEFPEGWEDEDVSEGLAAVADKPTSTRLTDSGNWFAQGTHRGVEMTAVVRPDGSIEAGWPTGGAGVKRNPR
ncbi:MAG: EndoU domain-containing protein, partial [Stackebrandtia sp.]